ncbi:polysaccharide export protein [Oribacterium sp. C9]|nr:polysaccharide export protein [Oribacterium sp. C9]
MRSKKDDTIEIDLLELYIEIKRRLWLLILSAVLCGAMGYMVSRFVLTPTYTSTSMIYVVSKETTLTSLADLQIGSQLTNDYKVLVTSRTVLEDVIKRLALDMNYLELRRKITLNNPANTRILNISLLDTDPGRAKQLTDTVADCASDYIADIMEQDPPKIIEYGEIPLRKTGPNTMRNAVMTALAGVMIVCGGIFINIITNDAIKTEDDIERYFGVPVLASIPEIDEKAAEKARHYGYDYRKSKKGEKG